MGKFISASDYTNLKKLVRNEIIRRNGNGSVSKYDKPEYEYTEYPKAGVISKVEHIKKIQEPERKSVV